MTRRKIIGLSVGGLCAITAIGNAVSPSTPPHKAKAATPIAHVVKAKPKHSRVKVKPYRGHCNPYDCYAPCRKATLFDSNPACDKALAISQREDERRSNKQAAHELADAQKEAKRDANKPEPKGSCAANATALAAVEALSGNVGGAVGAGKLALATAGTGTKC